ncbi:MAG TPA: hypothetical protein VGN95_15165 [Pyrinomonadaceae bacterium]|nr:hypothetical protein [Pyrinomonadaceae bacterium]
MRDAEPVDSAANGNLFISMMGSRLWYMNADFEVELAHTVGPYRRLPTFEALNQRLAPHLLWLARAGDALLLSEPWSESLQREAERRKVELISIERSTPQSTRIFTPWGWTPSAVATGEQVGAIVRPVPGAIVARVNSKLWSHALEIELGLKLPGAATASTFEELEEAVARACPQANEKWVVKSQFGFAARERVLGRGPKLEEPQAKWSRRRLAKGESLIFQPWLEVIREYGVVMEISRDGAFEIQGISDLQTNGAGTGTGYILGRPPSSHRASELERIASLVSERLFKEGYYGPVGIDALEHAGGFHPLLEINARYTMGFVAVAVERSLKPAAPTFWSTKTDF